MRFTLPELVDCSDVEDEECDAEYCYDTVNSFVSTLSLCIVEADNEQVGYGSRFYNENEIQIADNSKYICGGESTLKNHNKTTEDKTRQRTDTGSRSNLLGAVSLLDFQANSLQDQRQSVTTMWSLEYNPFIDKFQFAVTDKQDADDQTFVFTTVSVKLPRNDPQHWYHYITHNTYERITTMIHFKGLKMTTMSNDSLTHSNDLNHILSQVWILDGTEQPIGTEVRTLNSLVIA